MKARFLIPVLAIILAASCGDNKTDDGSVSLQFKADFGDAPLTMFTRSYAYPEGMNVKFQNFLFYVSDVTLIKEDGTEHALSEVELISFKDIQDYAAAAAGVVTKAAKVPPGNYKAVKMGIGIAPDLNGTQPGDYKPGHPLTDNYWSWALGYIFTKIEGNADLNGDGNYDENAKLTFHIGANSLYRVKTFNTNFSVETGEEVKLPFTLDLRKVLVNDAGNFLDFRVTRQDHTNDMNVAQFIIDNLNAAIRTAD